MRGRRGFSWALALTPLCCAFGCALVGYDANAPPDAGARDVPSGGSPASTAAGRGGNAGRDAGGFPGPDNDIPGFSGAARCGGLQESAECSDELSCQRGRCLETPQCQEDDEDCGRICDQAPGCYLPCEGEQCSQQCTGSGDCIAACGDAESCYTHCDDGAVCLIGCGESDCGGDCRGDGTFCVYECGDADQCDNIVCSEGAVCALFCRGNDECSFRDGDGCQGELEYCPLFDIWVCGESCATTRGMQ